MPIKKRRNPPRRVARKGEAQAFLEAAINSDTDECILWPFSLTTYGYGKFNKPDTCTYAHREVLLRVTPQPPDKPLALHAPEICHNRQCVNPKHLRWGDYLDNKQDSFTDGSVAVGVANGRSKLTDDEVRAIYVSDLTYRQLAESYDITMQMVGQIKAGKRRARVTKDLTPCFYRAKSKVRVPTPSD